MSSGVLKAGVQSKPGPGLPAGTPNSQAILFDKLHRRATPDSEALASSDDEAEHRPDQSLPSVQPHKPPVRRSSWLNDTSQAAIRPRKGSFASSNMSPTASHPSTPSVESGAGTWGNLPTQTATLSRAHTAGSTFPWSTTAIWNTERKEPPSRLAEVLPSPTSTYPPVSSATIYGTAELGQTQTSPGPRDPVANSQIPFAIPLHPTPKTYRSQSYSVGQLEPEAPGNPMMPNTIMGARRQMPHSGLQHRPSRPSMLSEMSSEGMLGKVKEVEDDEETQESLIGNKQQSAEHLMIEHLARENLMLRQQQQQQQQQNARLRPRASTGFGNGYGLQAAVPEESDFAVDELEDLHDGSDYAAKRAMGRRMSEFGVGGGVGQFRSPLENRKLENVKKAFWQSSLGFSGLGDIPQSRRHSFADIPQRQASISSLSEHVLAHEMMSQEPHAALELNSPFSDNSAFASPTPAAYFTGGMPVAAPQQTIGHNAAFGNPYAYAIHQPFNHRPASPHRAMYGISQPSRATPLNVVLFKCARADVFYIQEGTGLTVKLGDLVIVEADRGTDLGTVAAVNVDWQEAKRAKEHFAEEQYKWLMMYSQNAGVAQDGVGAGLMAASNGLQGSAIGGMGPPGQHHMQEPSSGELKPKLIKRLAQAHEVQALRDKEGQEAKAKRVCMQKVKEHGLNMEILDAEFQMDWKKLTFYYFADSYINFNSLVTDLFKIYKTRIWMSAINPASFATQPLGLQAPSGIGPGAVGVGRSGASSERRPAQPEQQATRSFQPQGATFAPAYSAERPVVPAAGYANTNYQFPGYAGFTPTGRAVGGVPYGSVGIVSSVDHYAAAGFPQGGLDYSAGRRLPTPQTGGPGPLDDSVSPLTAPADITGAFQGLSLNSR